MKGLGEYFNYSRCTATQARSDSDIGTTTQSTRPSKTRKSATSSMLRDNVFFSDTTIPPLWICSTSLHAVDSTTYLEAKVRVDPSVAVRTKRVPKTRSCASAPCRMRRRLIHVKLLFYAGHDKGKRVLCTLLSRLIAW